MASKKRQKTKYPGVFYYDVSSKPGTRPDDKVYYIRYRKNSKAIEEKVGHKKRDAMTAAKASGIRASRINGESLSNAERRDRLKTKKEADLSRWTIGRLWEAYSELRPQNRNHLIDMGRYKNHLAKHFANKEPKELIPLDIDRLRLNLLKKLSPQTTKHVLSLLKRLINFGVKKGLCPPLHFIIEMPFVDNVKNDALTDEQLSALWQAAEEDPDPHAGAIVQLALTTGMRRGELFNLKWTDIDFEKKCLVIRSPKGGKGQSIPLNRLALNILKKHPVTESEFVFPGKNGAKRTSAQKSINRIKKKAGIPDEIRPLHRLRHTFATIMVNSGEVDMYTLQMLTTHKSPDMLQRYAHLGDNQLRKASRVAERNILQIIAEPLLQKTS